MPDLCTYKKPQTSGVTGVNNVPMTKWVQFVNRALIVDESWGFSSHVGAFDFPSTSSSVVLCQQRKVRNCLL